LIGHHRDGTDVAIAQDFRVRLRNITEHKAGWIAAHDFSDLHISPPNLQLHRLGLLRQLDLVDDLSITGIGLRDTQRKVALFFAGDGTSENHQVLIDMNPDVAIA
jgi:hypothetical protein